MPSSLVPRWRDTRQTPKNALGRKSHPNVIEITFPGYNPPFQIGLASLRRGLFRTPAVAPVRPSVRMSWSTCVMRALVSPSMNRPSWMAALRVAECHRVSGLGIGGRISLTSASPSFDRAVRYFSRRYNEWAVWVESVIRPQNCGWGGLSLVKLVGQKQPETQKQPQQAVIPTKLVEQATEEVETLHTSLQLGAIAQVVIALVAIIGLLYLLKLVVVTILFSILIAYVLEPLVALLVRWHFRRWLAAMLVIILTIAVAMGLVYFSYNRAVEFVDKLPQYTATLRKDFNDARSRVDKIANQARSVVEPPNGRPKAVPVRVEQTHGLVDLISENGSAIADILLAVGFVPFLVYFMLASKDHVHVSTVRLFPKEHRLEAHRTVGTISGMIRAFIVANVAVGAVSSVICAIVFWKLGIEYFYFIGAISGFVSLIPYLGIFLALIPPLASGAGTLHEGGFLTVIITVVSIHLITMNWIYPRVIGSRLQLNALAVSLSLLFWGWIWGAPGLVLAIPILGAVKIVCDHTDALQGLGSWLGE